ELSEQDNREVELDNNNQRCDEPEDFATHEPDHALLEDVPMPLTSALRNCRARPPAIGLIALAVLLVAGCSSPKQRVVLYCAQDQEFAEELLRGFTDRSGLHVDVKYDTEADKSVSLYTELLREKDRPRCDVHWNNEIIGTIRLWKRGVLESYDSPS